ncbi:hypothetical protein AX16_004242 [Volvariella volvacea WC 439]|nr:hypothetical protein AX16_004242 [Volvariella volvacea WC 439]
MPAFFLDSPIAAPNQAIFLYQHHTSVPHLQIIPDFTSTIPALAYSMSLETSSLYSLARSKMHSSTGSRDSLHRWVLLKNSILQPSPLSASTSTTDLPACSRPYSDDLEDDDDEPDVEITSYDPSSDSFMFPDAGRFVNNRNTESFNSEAEWLDSLLESLGDDDDDEFSAEQEPSATTLPEEDEMLSPIGSPMSSSDDLPNQPSYYPQHISVSYAVSYPVYHSVSPYAFDPSFGSPSSFSSPLDQPLPYHNLDHLEELPVPEAIEDTSDDESDSLTTPSTSHTSSGSPPVDTNPLRQSRLRHTSPHVFGNKADPSYPPFDLDPLPFPVHHHQTYNSYDDC